MWDGPSYKERPWFNWDEDALTPANADRVLARGKGRPLNEQLIHLIFSLRAAERVRLGGEERLYAAMVEATRAAMRVFAAEVGATDFVWAASARADYPNPCVKVLIERKIGTGPLGRPVLQMRLPPRLESGWTRRRAAGEERRWEPGPCGAAFLKVLDEAGES
ncbi:MAG: hypothetical protein ACJ741_15800 [Pyrinomonadaceae bacterium]